MKRRAWWLLWLMAVLFIAIPVEAFHYFFEAIDNRMVPWLDRLYRHYNPDWWRGDA